MSYQDDTPPKGVPFYPDTGRRYDTLFASKKMIGWVRNFSSNIKKIGPARFLIYLGFILIPLSNSVSVFKWNRGPEASSMVTRPDYPFGTALLLTGLVLIFLGPWLSKGPFVQRLAVFGITFAVFMIYMIPMTILFVGSGVPFQD